MKNNRKCMMRAAMLVALALLMPAVVLAQYRAGLQGSVTDPDGAVIPNAKITLVDKATNRTLQTTSNADGTYSFSRLAPSNYMLTVEATGFVKEQLSNITVQGEVTTGLDVKLHVGAVTETVQVTDATPLINTQNAQVGGTISTEQIQSLPSTGRDPFQLLQLAPGMFGDSSRAGAGGASNLPGNAGPGGASTTSSIFQTENQAQVSANGTRNISNNMQVDGVSVNSLAWGGAAVITPNEESVKEVRVSANPYDAESGHNSGGQVQVVSKAGSNSWHGSGFFKFHRPGLNAYQRYNGPGTKTLRDSNKFNQFGGSVGGPIWKDKLFFFFSYETLRNNSISFGNDWYETPQYIQTLASRKANGIGTRLYNYKGMGVSYTGINAKTCSDIGLSSASCRDVNGGLDLGSPTSTALGTPDPTYVSSGTPGVGGGFDGVPDVFNVTTANPVQNTFQQFQGRADAQITHHDLLTYTMYWVPSNSTSYNGPIRSANLWHSNRLNYAASLLWNHTFNPTLVNEARGNVTRWYFNEVTSNPQEPWGLPTLTTDVPGTMQTALQPAGAPGPGVFYQTTYNFRDVVTKTVSSHTIKAGADLYWEQDNDVQAGAARPQYFFRNLWDVANDVPYKESGNFDPRTGSPTSNKKYIRSNIWAGFIQDDWKALPNLTLNFGLRWEYFTPVREKYNNLSNVVLGQGNALLTGASIRVGGDLYGASKNNWGPQVGFAFTPKMAWSKPFVIRGGFGIGYNRMQQAITLNGRANPPLVTNLTLQCTNVNARTGCGSILYQTPSTPTSFDGYPSNPSAKQTFDSKGLPVGGTALSLTGFPLSLQTPVTYGYSLTASQELGGNWVATVGYQGSSTRHYTRQLNLNWNYPNIRDSRIQNMYYYVNDANANFNAGWVELNHRFSRMFDIDAQYRYAKSMDNGSNDYYIGEYPYDIRYATGPSDYDVKHNVKLYGTFRPVLFRGNDWKEKIAGNWEFSGIMNWHSGYPWQPLYSNYGGNIVYSGSGYSSLRAGGYRGGAGTSQSNDAFKTGSNYGGDALKYFTVPNYTAGSGIPPAPGVGRNSLRGPGYFNLDMTAQKGFGLPKWGFLGENAKFVVRADFFNILNKLNLDPTSITNTISADGIVSNKQFGIAQRGLGARVIEFTGRFNF
ncbi:carboxypeptidase regulatory-like domain-containing protein [Terriglobus sp. 2YAB30_2]|uniref:TonB-dependent receptor n=1 Tax=Terriglobus sp. 2YAB30_2 TaxID=3233023 RepID=UPI003F9DAE6C